MEFRRKVDYGGGASPNVSKSSVRVSDGVKSFAKNHSVWFVILLLIAIPIIILISPFLWLIIPIPLIIYWVVSKRDKQIKLRILIANFAVFAISLIIFCVIGSLPQSHAALSHDVSSTSTTGSAAGIMPKTTVSTSCITSVPTTSAATSAAITTSTQTATVKATTVGKTTAQTVKQTQTENQTKAPSQTQANKSSGIQLNSITSPIGRNETATLSIKGDPNTKYSINVYYSSTNSTAAGLESKTSDASGNVSWSWKIGGKTAPGTHRIVITGGGKTFETSIITTE